MPMHAHCSGCGRRVQLTAEGECPRGHLRSMLRDIREGTLAVEPSTPVVPVRKPASSAGQSDLAARIIGRSIVIVPIALLVAFGLWTSYEQGVGSGMNVGAAIMLSVASLGATIGGAFVWAAMRKRSR